MKTLENKENLLELAARIGEFGKEKDSTGAMQVVDKTLRNIMMKNTENLKILGKDDDMRLDFLEMLRLYCIKADILGGGKALKRSYEDFVKFLGIRFNNKQAIWDNKELKTLTMIELSYVLGWACRIGKKGDGGSSNSHPTKGSQKNPMNKVDIPRQNPPVEEIEEGDMEEKLKRLVNKHCKPNQQRSKRR